MQKEKLKQIRIQKGITQQQCAEILPTDVSNYCRKENGAIGITKSEWVKLANFLQVAEEDIYEEDEKRLAVTYENSTITISDTAGNFNTYCNIPESIIKNLQDFIAVLQVENERLRTEIAQLRKTE
jgi:transcriptional regulator with XRE-family HTH domain